MNFSDEACQDPYAKEPAMCILCPRRYAIPIGPDYKNPKLLAQFISPHTGFTYKKNITGLATNSIFLCFLFVKGLEGKSMTPHRGNTILFRSSQQLPHLRLRPLKGFLS